MESAKAINPQTLKELFKVHEKFAKCTLDAWALVDIDGKVAKSNPSFAKLVGESSKKILKADSFDDLIKLSIQGRSLGVAGLMEHQATTRIDEITAETDKRSEMTLIIGIYPFIAEDGRHLGSFLLIRDVTDDKALHDIYKTTKTDSITDQLTGLYTRRYFENYLTTAQKNSLNEGTPPDLSVIMVDIDHFKQVNDVYGHQAGDAILKTMGEVISKTFRKSDITCRYGGEEFIVLLPGTNIKGASIAADSLRIRVEATENIFQGKNIPITISCGVALFNFKEETSNQTIQRADESLYQAKENGRNQVQCNENGVSKAFVNPRKKDSETK